MSVKLNLQPKPESTITYSFKMYESVRGELDRISADSGISVANLVRTALNNLIDEDKL